MAETSEVKVVRYEAALRQIDGAITAGIRENGEERHRILLPDGSIIRGPAADFVRETLVAIRDRARSALQEP